ncbi:MAG: DUF2846 domain-containing protein [Gammaproteobacteria bacterium]|nr:DUF2846 domain-containing protein [Gammaproteobacteria bacterium]
MKLKSSVTVIISLLFVSLLSACASTSKLTVEEKEQAIAGYQLPTQPTGNEALVYIVRPDSGGSAVRFKVYLDGQKEDGKYIGYTRGKQYLTVPVSVGKHVINSKAENWASVDVSANDGDIIFLTQTPRLGFMFAGNNLEKIDSLDGKYFMSKYGLALGTYVDEDGKAMQQ